MPVAVAGFRTVAGGMVPLRSPCAESRQLCGRRRSATTRCSACWTTIGRSWRGLVREGGPGRTPPHCAKRRCGADSRYQDTQCMRSPEQPDHAPSPKTPQPSPEQPLLQNLRGSVDLPHHLWPVPPAAGRNQQAPLRDPHPARAGVRRFAKRTRTRRTGRGALTDQRRSQLDLPVV